MAEHTKTMQRCHHEICRKPFRWVSNEIGRRIPLDPDPVPARTRGAQVLIGERVFSLEGAVTHLTRRGFAQDEGEAVRMATEDYLWHLPHPAVCLARKQGASWDE